MKLLLHGIRNDVSVSLLSYRSIFVDSNSSMRTFEAGSTSDEPPY